MTEPRRFPAPWQVVETPGGWKVVDGNGVTVAYCYGDDRPRGANDHTLTRDEARRIAANIAKLPGLLSGRR